MVESLPDRRVSDDDPKPNRRAALLAGVASLAFLGTLFRDVRPAAAAMAVVDAGAIAQLAQQFNTLQQQFAELKKANDIGTDTLTAIGKGGGFSLPTTPWQSNTASALTNILPDLAKYPGAKGITPNFGTVNQARQFVEKVLFPADVDPKSKNRNQSFATAQDINAARTQALADASKAGLAYAATAKSTAPALSSEASDIMTAAGAAVDVRGQLAVTNRALAALLQEMAMQRTGIALICENIAAQNALKVPAVDYTTAPITGPGVK